MENNEPWQGHTNMRCAGSQWYGQHKCVQREDSAITLPPERLITQAVSRSVLIFQPSVRMRKIGTSVGESFGIALTAPASIQPDPVFDCGLSKTYIVAGVAMAR